MGGMFCPHVALVANSRNSVMTEDQPVGFLAKLTRVPQPQHHKVAPSLGASLETHMQREEEGFCFNIHRFAIASSAADFIQ